jgi:hypothetical protein
MNRNSKLTELRDIEDIAQQAQAGVDVSAHFTGKFQAKQNISLSLPLDLLRSIDAECQRQNIDRQDWIEQVWAEKIAELPSE